MLHSYLKPDFSQQQIADMKPSTSLATVCTACLLAVGHADAGTERACRQASAGHAAHCVQERLRQNRAQPGPNASAPNYDSPQLLQFFSTVQAYTQAPDVLADSAPAEQECTGNTARTYFSE
ncbi:hypothetical protein V8J88_11020 [Massilia sp. W12]|uniref:hypothetical protein n=1 Tax=Massilia sp. W12 TaxID=3126507 RepID=UPI0030D52E4F